MPATKLGNHYCVLVINSKIIHLWFSYHSRAAAEDCYSHVNNGKMQPSLLSMFPINQHSPTWEPQHKTFIPSRPAAFGAALFQYRMIHTPYEAFASYCQSSKLSTFLSECFQSTWHSGGSSSSMRWSPLSLTRSQPVTKGFFYFIRISLVHLMQLLKKTTFLYHSDHQSCHCQQNLLESRRTVQ